MKKGRRVFNFNLPNELREYIRQQADNRHTTISQYIIDLIVKDKEILQKITQNEKNNKFASVDR